MNLEQVRRWRTWVGKLVALFIVLMFVALFDGLVAQFRQPFNEYEVIPGTTVDINGPLAEEVQDVQELTYTSSSDDLQVSFTEIHRGFWLGGSMWRGKLKVGPHIPPGKYSLAVRPKWTSDKPPLMFRIIVYRDLLAMQQNSRSVIQRNAGVSPWAVSGLFLALIGLTVGVVLYLSGKLEKLLVHSGKAEIYRVEKLEGGYAIAFGLGTEHGVKVEDPVTILDPEGNQVGTAEVQKAAAKDSVGLARIDQHIRPGYIVSLNR
jgi:hypothetical protein